MEKLTTKQFNIFRAECLRLQKEWGLLGWRLYFEFKPLKNRYAEADIDLEGRLATLRLSSQLDNDVLEANNILHHAKHEMIHVLMGRLADLAHTRFLDKKEMNEAEEELVRILEKLL